MSKGGSSIPDEEWERFLKEAEAGTQSAPEEPSARARMVGQRLRDGKRPPQGWRTYQPRRRSVKPWYVVGFLLLVGLVVVALAPGRVAGWFGDGDEGGGRGSAGASPAAGAAPGLPTLDQPFRGSPAAQWEDGTAGISMPEARATGWMTKEQVAHALDQSLNFLADSSLDPGVLRGQQPKKAIALINPHQPDMQHYLSTAFREPSEKNNPLLLFSRFPQAKVRLVGDVVRTQGQVTFRVGKRGALEVTSDVTYVYPLVRAATGSHEIARTIVRRETVMSWDDPAKIITEPGTFSLTSYRMDATNGGCSNFTGYFIPEFTARRAIQGPGTGPEVDPYDRSTSMDSRMEEADKTACGTATRT